MSKGRIIILVVLVLVAVAVAGVFVLRGQLDGLVARAIEVHGTRVCGTAVTVGQVKLELREGRATILDLTIANPDGFSDRDAFALGKLVLDLDPGSLRAEPYVVDDIAVEDIRALLEVDGNGRQNLDVIRKNLESATPAPSGEATGEAAPAPLLTISRLSFTGGEVEADASALGVASRQASLPGFTLNDLGEPDGAPGDQIGKQVVEQLARQAMQAALDSELRSRLEDAAREQVGDDVEGAVKDKVGKLLGK